MRRALVLVLLVACTRSGAKVDDDPKVVTVKEASAAVKKGPIGADRPEEASYVLVDAENTSAQDRLVVVEGQLLGADGKPVAALAGDELRIPTKGVRTFALVADKVAPDGARPAFTVKSAVAIDYPAQIVISDEQEKKGDLFVATAKAKNVVERTASVVFACTYYDAAGKILARPFTVAEVPPGGEQTLRFEGPKEAARAAIFVGQVAFKQ